MNAVVDDDDDAGGVVVSCTALAREQEYIRAIVFCPIVSPTRYERVKGTVTVTSEEILSDIAAVLLLFKTIASYT